MFSGAARLPLVAGIKGSEPHMPISLVSISPADSMVTVASHDGCLKQYRVTAPDQTAGAGRSLENPSPAGNARSQLPDEPAGAPKSLAESHSAAEVLDQLPDAGNVSFRHAREDTSGDSNSVEAGLVDGVSDTRDSQQCLGNDGVAADILRALDMSDGSMKARNAHKQRTDHDREGGGIECTPAAENGSDQSLTGLPKDADNSSEERRRQHDISCTALGDLNVQAVSALTVIESQLLCKPRDEAPDHLLSGFQVGCQLHQLEHCLQLEKIVLQRDWTAGSH